MHFKGIMICSQNDFFSHYTKVNYYVYKLYASIKITQGYN